MQCTLHIVPQDGVGNLNLKPHSSEVIFLSQAGTDKGFFRVRYTAFHIRNALQNNLRK